MILVERKCRHVPFSNKPLILALGQVRFSPVRQIAKYIPAIQEEFRRNGFPVEKAGKIQQFTFGSKDRVPLRVDEVERWEYLTKNEGWSILVMQDNLVLQTTAYTKFEEFAEKLSFAVGTVFRITETEQLGVVHRVGLRYVNAIQPRENEDFRIYLQDGIRGISDEVFRENTSLLHFESAGKTPACSNEAKMIVRVVQNNQGYLLPPDLLGAAPKIPTQASDRKLVTLIDLDHFIEGPIDASSNRVTSTAFELHDHIIETFHNHVITPHAAGVWQ